MEHGRPRGDVPPLRRRRREGCEILAAVHADAESRRGNSDDARTRASAARGRSRRLPRVAESETDDAVREDAEFGRHRWVCERRFSRNGDNQIPGARVEFGRRERV